MGEKNNVERVNISLNSKYKTDELEVWIKKNNDITVYCSYNNKLNSLADYPAMYSDVIASGSDNKIKYKDIDIHYGSNKIILISTNGFKFFEGNSFLSLQTMLNKENNK